MSSGFDNAIKSFAQVLKELDKNKTSPFDTQAEVRRIEGNIAWVHIPGGVDETPVSLTINAKVGDSVQVRIGGGRGWILGNATNPPTDDSKADVAYNYARKTNQLVVNSIEAAEVRFDYVEADTAKIHNLEADEIHAGITYTNELIAGDITAENIIADHAEIDDLDVNYAKINAANITDLAAQNAWVNKIMIQTGLIAHESDIFTLDAIQVNAANITAGTIDVNRLIVTVNGQKYLVNVDPSTGTPSYEKMDGNIVEPRTITADKIVAHDITVQEITTENLVGTNGWINLSQGKFFYGDGASYASATNAIEWNGTTLRIKGDIGDSVVFNNYSTTQQMNSAIGNAVDGIEVGGRNLLKNTEVSLSTLGGSTTGGTSTKVIPAGSEITISVRVDADNVVWDTTSSYHRIGCETALPKSGGGNQYVGVWAGKEVSESSNIVFAFTGSFHGRVSKTFTLLADVTVDKGCALYIQGVASGTVTVSNIKLELGNKATDWTPAPEDVQAEIDSKKSIHTLQASNQSGATFASLLSWTTEGNYTSWGINTSTTPINNIKVGDTCRIAYKVSDMNNAVVYCVGEFKSYSGSTAYLTMHGLDSTIVDGGNILTNSVGANQIMANSIGAKHLTISDSTNLATANEIYSSSLPTEMSSDFLPAISSGYLVKKVATQRYLMVCNYTPNNFKQNDELYYEFYAKAATAGTVYLGAYGYTGTGNPVYSHQSYASISLSTTEQFYSGTLPLSDSRWSTVTRYLLGFDDDRSTKSQIYLRKVIIRRKSAGELIVDGSITADKIAANTISIGKLDTTAQGYVQQGVDAKSQLTVKDTRNDNQSPKWYIDTYASTQREVREFKYANKIGCGSSAIFGYLTTRIPWSDSSGGYPKQSFEMNGRLYVRQGTNDTTWSAWKDVAGIADTYITQIDAAGIFISPSNQSPTSSAPGNSVRVNGSGLEVFKGGTSEAFFGSTARIGVSDGKRLELKSDGVYIYNGTTQYGYFGSFARIGDYNSNNVKMDSSGVHINSSTDTVVSEFTSSGASLGNNSDSAVINLCGKKGSISGAYTNSNNTYNLRIYNNYSLSSNNNMKAIYIENSGSSSSLANRIIMEQTKLYGRVTLVAGSHSIMVDSDEVGISLKGVTVTTTTLTAGGTLYSTGNTMCVNDNSQWCGNSSHRWKAVYALDTSINTSDRKEKDHIKDIDFAKELIMSLEPVEYMWKSGDHRRKRMGFIAQDVAKVCKDLNENLSLVYASYGHEGEDIDVPYYGEDVDDELLHWSLSYDQLIAPMTVVIQQQQEEIDILKTEVANLKGVNNVYSS